MKRQLPTLDLAGTTFVVDVENLCLYQKDNPPNTISFFDMENRDTNYRFSYDVGRKNLLMSIWHQDGDEIRHFTIPPMIRLDPEGMALKYGTTVEEVRKMYDRELKCDERLLEKRLMGILPQIDIAGETFTIDWRLRELRLNAEPTTHLSFDQMDFNDRGTEYFCLYHKATHQIVQVDQNIVEFPKGVIALTIPGELRLDPVGVARQYGVGIQSIVDHYPIKEKLQAEVLSLEETPLLRMIQRNRAYYGMKPLPVSKPEKKEEQRPSLRKRQGPHQ